MIRSAQFESAVEVDFVRAERAGLCGMASHAECVGKALSCGGVRERGRREQRLVRVQDAPHVTRPRADDVAVERERNAVMRRQVVEDESNALVAEGAEQPT